MIRENKTAEDIGRAPFFLQKVCGYVFLEIYGRLGEDEYPTPIPREIISDRLHIMEPKRKESRMKIDLRIKNEKY